MKIVFLNTLDAEIAEPLRTFLQKHIPDTDIFCFQECYANMHALLAEFDAPFTEISGVKPVLGADSAFTIVTFVRNTISIESSNSNADTKNTGLALFSTLQYNGKEIHIANVHGLPEPGKSDNPNRLEQSQEIIDAFQNRVGIKIIGGDINVDLDTKSVLLFEKAGYKNLIRDFDIKTTRNEIAWAKHPGNELYFSDYVFVKDTEVAAFEVPPEIVSDHQPMILTVNW